MKILTFLLICLLSGFSSVAQTQKIKVYLLGTFHFNQTDTTVYDVRSENHQLNIRQIAQMISDQQPDKIFVELMPEWEKENRIDSIYQVYRKGGLRMARNEIWQIGARVAAGLNHPHIYQCDHPGMYGYHYGMLDDYAKLHQQENLLQYKGKGMTPPLTSLIDTDSLRNSVSLLEYMRWLNSPEVQNTSHAHYINVYPQIGNTRVTEYDSTYFLGAALTIDWYRRNILIYSKILAQLDYSEKAIFLVIGNDHVPILKELFNGNPFFEVMNTEAWLGRTTIKSD